MFEPDQETLQKFELDAESSLVKCDSTIALRVHNYSYSATFIGKDMVLGTIDTGEAKPIKQRPWRTPLAYREKAVTMIGDMLARGVVVPSRSSWASPVVLVTKKDSSLRFCVDYRRLNAITRKDVYPLPQVDDIPDSIGKNPAHYFSKLDLRSGYWQVKMAPDDQEKTASFGLQALSDVIWPH